MSNAGWQRSAAGDVAEFWTKNNEFEVLVPRRRNAPDFEARLNILTLDLERVEERPATAIRDDISRQFLDITHVRAEHEFGEMFIPLDAGHKLFATAKDLVVSAAASTLHRRGYYGRSMPRSAREQAKRTLVGHTRPGSYIVPVITQARLPELPWQSDQPHLIEHVEAAAFERRATTTLAHALGALEEIATSRSRPSVRVVNEAVGEGLSFEMCRAISRPLQDSIIHKVNVDIAWAPGVTAPAGAGTSFNFPKESADNLKVISATLKNDPLDSQEVIYGVVVSLKSRSGDDGGRVEVETLIDGAKRLVRIELSEQAYEIARTSHKRSPVVARGTLHRNPGRMAVMEAAFFERDLSLPLEESIQ
ncbi:hypothetical protein AB0C22_16645 [Micromonospora sp. NPDC048894]|uniref:hypothetical protein n=1 Tax=Micromonospora sp. NPDC048894 TaxID=3155493 RepID=UPI00340295AE